MSEQPSRIEEIRSRLAEMEAEKKALEDEELVLSRPAVFADLRIGEPGVVYTYNGFAYVIVAHDNSGIDYKSVNLESGFIGGGHYSASMLESYRDSIEVIDLKEQNALVGSGATLTFSDKFQLTVDF